VNVLFCGVFSVKFVNFKRAKGKYVFNLIVRKECPFLSPLIRDLLCALFNIYDA
jgi:hypothetical protein